MAHRHNACLTPSFKSVFLLLLLLLFRKPWHWYWAVRCLTLCLCDGEHQMSVCCFDFRFRASTLMIIITQWLASFAYSFRIYCQHTINSISHFIYRIIQWDYSFSLLWICVCVCFGSLLLYVLFIHSTMCFFFAKASEEPFKSGQWTWKIASIAAILLWLWNGSNNGLILSVQLMVIQHHTKIFFFIRSFSRPDKIRWLVYRVLFSPSTLFN